jgi:hypothetical protein
MHHALMAYQVLAREKHKLTKGSIFMRNKRTARLSNLWSRDWLLGAKLIKNMQMTRHSG